MKHLITALAIALASPAYAEAETKDPCAIWGDLAEMAMTARQKGVSLSRALRDVTDDLVRQVIIDAYEKPRYSGAQFQRREIQDYRSHWELLCYQAE